MFDIPEMPDDGWRTIHYIDPKRTEADLAADAIIGKELTKIIERVKKDIEEEGLDVIRQYFPESSEAPVGSD